MPALICTTGDSYYFRAIARTFSPSSEIVYLVGVGVKA
jgi:hypothetical protein